MVAVFLALVVWPSAQHPSHGFAAYYTASRLALTEGLDARVYDDVWFRAQTEAASGGAASDIFNANPPTMALLALPVAGLPLGAARWIWTGFNAALLFGALYLLGRALHLGRSAALFGLALALFGAPTLAQFRFGQAYVVVLCLYIFVWLGLRSRRDWLAGIGLALAMALKLAGAPLWLFALVLGRRRALAWAGGIVFAVVVISLPVVSADAWRAFFLSALPAATRSSALTSTAYQSLPGFWAHLLRADLTFNPAPLVDWPPGAALFTALDVTLMIGVSLYFARKLPLDEAFAVVAVASVITAPFVEQHQYVVLMLPVFIALAQSSYVIPGEHSSRRIPLTSNGMEIPRRFAPRSEVVLTVFLVLALAFIALPLPFQSSQLAAGWLALLAYPRLYGALLLWAVLIAQESYHAP